MKSDGWTCNIYLLAGVVRRSYCYRNYVRSSVPHTSDPRLNGCSCQNVFQPYIALMSVVSWCQISSSLVYGFNPNECDKERQPLSKATNGPILIRSCETAVCAHVHCAVKNGQKQPIMTGTTSGGLNYVPTAIYSQLLDFLVKLHLMHISEVRS